MTRDEGDNFVPWDISDNSWITGGNILPSYSSEEVGVMWLSLRATFYQRLDICKNTIPYTYYLENWKKIIFFGSQTINGLTNLYFCFVLHSFDYTGYNDNLYSDDFWSEGHQNIECPGCWSFTGIEGEYICYDLTEEKTHQV